MRRFRLRRLVIAFSLANLCCLNPWIVLLMDPCLGYLRPRPPERLDYAALAALVALLGLLFLAADRLAMRLGPARAGALRSAGFLAAALFVLNSVRLLHPGRFGLNVLVNAYGTAAVAAALLLGALGIAVLLRRRLKAAVAAALFAVQVLSPLLPLFLAMAAVRALAAPGAWPERRPAPLHSPARNDRRVIVLVFDEMDQAQAFTARDPALRLPELDRFRAASLYATNAYPPAGRTLEAMPSLINGRIVADVRFAGPADILLRYEGTGRHVPWTGEMNLFRELHAEGFNSALSGWFHPYPRVLDGPAYCRWHPMTAAASCPLGDRLWRQGVDLLGLLPGARLIHGSRAADPLSHLRNFRRMREEALALARDRRFNLVFLHWPIPHPPGIFDRALGRLVERGGAGGYADNLALADRTLGELRRAMSAGGMWDQTAVIVTSDHWRRMVPNVHFRVPFLVKLDGRQPGRTFAGEFNTVILRDLVRDLLHGRIAGVEGLAAWLGGRGSRRGIGYYRKMKI